MEMMVQRSKCTSTPFVFGCVLRENERAVVAFDGQDRMFTEHTGEQTGNVR